MFNSFNLAKPDCFMPTNKTNRQSNGFNARGDMELEIMTYRRSSCQETGVAITI